MANKLVDRNPMLKKPILTLLPICEQHDGESRAIIEDEAAAAWSPSFKQVPASVIDALVRAGCLVEQITVDGQPYGGTLEDAYFDEEVDAEAEVDSLLSITDDGRAVMTDYAPQATLAALLQQRPHYKRVFQAAVQACTIPEGISRSGIEQAIDQAISEESLCATNGGKIYPQYFIDALETAGGIEWDGAWRATETGRSMLASQKNAN